MPSRFHHLIRHLQNHVFEGLPLQYQLDFHLPPNTALFNTLLNLPNSGTQVPYSHGQVLEAEFAVLSRDCVEMIEDVVGVGVQIKRELEG
jgi:hypothetical protein